jgi:restriction endonuclease Mrr
MAPPTSLIRSVAEQQPQNLAEEKIISAILEYCKDDPYIFESAATDIWMKSCSLGMNVDVTRRWKDGGKDAIGNLILGPKSDPIKINFALEAKCYSPSNNVGVQEMSRLISRLKYREFGVLVTTSAVNAQAYKEIRADEHPIVVISGTDIAQVLISKRINSPKEVKIWMDGLSHQT